MNIERVKSAMIEQYKEMCEEFSETPQIAEPMWTYLGPMWNINAVRKRCFAVGQCEGARRLLEQLLTEDEYNQLMSITDKLVEANVFQNEKSVDS